MPPKQAERTRAMPAGSLGQQSDRPQGYRFMNDPGMLRALDNVTNREHVSLSTRSRRRRSSPSRRGRRPDGTMDLRQFVDDEGSKGSDEGGGSDNSLIGARKKQRRERKRRTKAQREAEAIAPLIRPVDEFPPQNKLVNRDILQLGAAGVGELEKEKTGWKSKGAPEPKPIRRGDDFDLDRFHSIDRLIDKHERRMNRTDLSSYKRKRPTLGLDDEDVDYEDDPVLYTKRDSALKASADHEGNQHRASRSALGTSTSPRFIRSSTFGPSHRSGDFNEDLSATDQTALPHQEHIDENNGNIDALFEDIDDIENRIAPGDVVDPCSPKRPLHQGDRCLQNDETPIRTDFTWTQAEAWAKTLRRIYGNDFFDNDKLDEEKILHTVEIEKPEALKNLEDEAVAIKIEQEDELFFAMAEEEERRELERLEREKRRAPLLARHRVGQQLFEQLRGAVAILAEQREQERRFMSRPGTSESFIPVQRSQNRPPSSGQPYIVPNNDSRWSESLNTGTSSLTLADRRDRGRRGTTEGEDRVCIDTWLANSQRGGGIDSNYRRGQHRGGLRVTYGGSSERGGRRDTPGGRLSSRNEKPSSNHRENDSSRNQNPDDRSRNDIAFERNESMGPPRGPLRGHHRGNGRQRAFPLSNDRRFDYTPSNASSSGRDYGWGVNDNRSATNDNDDYVPWNPTDDDLDPIKAQFGV